MTKQRAEQQGVVERVKSQAEGRWRNGVTVVRQDDLKALLAVVEAAQEFARFCREDDTWSPKLDAALARLQPEPSEEQR